MTNKELMTAGELHYFEDDEIRAMSEQAQLLIEEYNSVSVKDEKRRTEIMKRLLGKTDGWFCIKPPFHCDYGAFIEIGEGTFINYDCIILDACTVKIGKNVLIGPRTCIYSATHPIYAPVRTAGYDISKPVTIGDNVWLGGNVTVNPGVTIGDGTVIGSGSVVTKDIPANVVAAGNPCRIIREITDDDKYYWETQKEKYLQNKNRGN